MGRILIFMALCTAGISVTPGVSAATLDGEPANEAYFLDFTGLDGSTTDPANFTFPTTGGDVVLTGSTAGVGNFSSATPLLYRSGTEAWIAEPGDILSVVFPEPVAVLEFYAATVDPAQIFVVGEVNEDDSVDLIAGASGVFSFSGSITGFTLENLSIDPDLDLCNAYCASIDDLGFTPVSVVPVPAAAWLFVSALGLLGWLRHPLDPARP